MLAPPTHSYGGIAKTTGYEDNYNSLVYIVLNLIHEQWNVFINGSWKETVKFCENILFC